MAHTQSKKTPKQIAYSTLTMTIGSILAAYALEVFLIPNQIIDGGVVGCGILLSKLFGKNLFYLFVLLLNIPFIALAYKYIAKSFVLHMAISVTVFSIVGHTMADSAHPFFAPYTGDLLEIVVIGGILLGLGVGLIIRTGGCLDGSEILGIIFNKKYSVSVGSVVLGINIVIFSLAGFVFENWHPPIKSLITFFIVMKVMDMVIMGFDEMKSIMIFSSKSNEIADSLMHEMGLGLTFIKGKGGFTGEDRFILFLIAERLQLSEIKTIAHNTDPHSLVAISNLHEVATSNMHSVAMKNKMPKK